MSPASAQAIHYSSKSEEWYTPAPIIEAVIEALGGIDIDPCSNSHGAPNVPAAVHYTKEDNGLVQEWHGRLFMNPPYGRKWPAWVDKAIEEIDAGRVTEAVILVAARPETRAFNALAARCQRWCAIGKRLHFSGCKDSAQFPSAAFYIGENIKEFDLAFNEHGKIWVLADRRDQA